MSNSETRDKYLDLTRELKKLWIMKVTMIPIVVGALGTIPNEDLEIRGQGNNNPVNSIKIGQNTEKRSGNSRRLSVTQS